MKKQISFNHLEKDLGKEFRNSINNAEGPIDVANNFSFVACKLFKMAFTDSGLKFEDDCVLFNPEEKRYFTVKDKLIKDHKFRKVWDNSDLPDLLYKFAEASYHKYLRYNKHLEKTNKKIRN